MKKIAFIGNFGHWPQVANELRGRSGWKAVGAAPAYEGEDVSGLRDHPALPDTLRLFGSAAELLSVAKPDITVVSTRPDHIADAAVLAADSGCDIICEKPLGITCGEAEAVRAAVQRNGIRLLPMLSMRTDPVFIKARELYRAGAIGEAVTVSARKSYPFGFRPEWFGDRAKYGGTFPWVGIHAVDIIHFVTGCEFVSVTARHTNFSHPERPDCEDSCAAVFELNNGAFAAVTADLLRPSEASTYGDDRIRIAGTKGVLEAVSNDGAVRLINENGESTVRGDVDPVSFYAEILQNAGDPFPLVDFDDGFLLTRAVLKARQSADQNGTPVLIDLKGIE